MDNWKGLFLFEKEPRFGIETSRTVRVTLFRSIKAIRPRIERVRNATWLN